METKKRNWIIHAIGLIILVGVFGCKQGGNSGAGQAGSDNADRPVTVKFKPPDIPAMITDPSLRLAYYVKHYWDHVDFADTAYIHSPEITEQAWVDYIDLLHRMPLDKAQEEMKAMMSKSAQNDKKFFLYFTEMADKYLYDPNSPAMNEELYIPVLEVMLQTPALDDTEKIRPQHRLELAYKNRQGTKASDFQYAGITGQTGSLYRVNADFMLLFFNNPECTTCKEYIEGIRNSAVINKLFVERRLKILSIYPDQDVDEWKQHYAIYPSEWIIGYDPTFTIGTIYDLKASPTLYLLDKDRTVLLKDASLGLVEGYLMNFK